jgi:N-acetylgalactosamine-N,N'-diacetylbacillosaminyl-diphospho-undecaprenol 4-alpha-N-acetylgalactosaminyltransferase
MKDSKPNISILITSFTSGGAEKVISLLLKKMVLDFNVTLVLFYNEIHFPIPKQVKVILLSKNAPSRGFPKKIMDLFKFHKMYERQLEEGEIKYSLSFLAFPNLINGLLSKKNRNYATLLSERGFPSDNTTSKASFIISKLFYPLLYNRCDRLFSNSTFINQDLKENFNVSIPMEVIYNPLEIPESTINSSKLSEAIDSLRIITIGSVDKRKNQIMVIRALKTLNDPSMVFEIYGTGPLEDYLNREITKLRLGDRVFLKGKTKRVNPKLLEAHIFILSSFTEGFPNALMEAMAVGLPCISTNCLSGPLEMLNEGREITIKMGDFAKAKYGILVNNDDDIGLSKAIKYLKEHPKERENYSKLSLERAETYQLDSIYSQFRKFILNP